MTPIGFRNSFYLSEQEIFDFVVAALWEQNAASYDTVSESCLYKNHDGSKCAVGLMMTGEELEAVIAGYSNSEPVYALRHIFGLEGVEENSDRMLFLRDIQDVHDDYANYGRYSELPMQEYTKPGFVRVANKYNLKTDILENAA